MQSGFPCSTEYLTWLSYGGCPHSVHKRLVASFTKQWVAQVSRCAWQSLPPNLTVFVSMFSFSACELLTNAFTGSGPFCSDRPLASAVCRAGISKYSHSSAANLTLLFAVSLCSDVDSGFCSAGSVCSGFVSLSRLAAPFVSEPWKVCRAAPPFCSASLVSLCVVLAAVLPICSVCVCVLLRAHFA